MRVTPTDQPELWEAAFLAAFQAVEGTHKGMEPREAYRQKKADIDAILSSIHCVGAYELDGNSRPWILSSRIKDPMCAPIVSTDITKKITRDINGFKHRSMGAGEYVLEKSEDQKYLESPPVEVPVAGDETPAFKVPHDYTWGTKEQRRIAARRGQKVAVMAAEKFPIFQGGKNPEKVELAGQMGWCVSLREQGLPPHTRLEVHLARKGIRIENQVKAA